MSEVEKAKNENREKNNNSSWRENTALICSIFALVIAGFSYLDSRRALDISENEFEARFQIVWDANIISDNNNLNSQPIIKFSGLAEGQQPQEALFHLPSSISKGHYLLSRTGGEIPIWQHSDELIDLIQTKIPWLGDLPQDEGRFITFTTPILVTTRFTSGGLLKTDTSVYNIVYDVISDKQISDNVFLQFKSVTYGMRYKQNNDQLGIYLMHLDEIWNEQLQFQSDKYNYSFASEGKNP